MREVSMLVWREGSGARVERGDRHAPHVAHMVLFSGYVRLHAPDVSRRAPRVVALVRARHLCRPPPGGAIKLGLMLSRRAHMEEVPVQGARGYRDRYTP